MQKFSKEKHIRPGYSYAQTARLSQLAGHIYLVDSMLDILSVPDITQERKLVGLHFNEIRDAFPSTTQVSGEFLLLMAVFKYEDILYVYPLINKKDDSGNNKAMILELLQWISNHDSVPWDKMIMLGSTSPTVEMITVGNKITSKYVKYVKDICNIQLQGFPRRCKPEEEEFLAML